MLTEYIEAAMNHACYELIDDRDPHYGLIPDCPGVWATAGTLEECRKRLQSVLEEWIVLGLRLGHPLPSIDMVSGYFLGDLNESMSLQNP